MSAYFAESDSEDELPPGWEERATADGSVYYVNHNVKATQWSHPRTKKKKKVTGDLPFGWERIVDESGKIMFADHTNKTVTFTDPRLAFATEEKDHPTDFRQRFDGSSTALQILHGRDLSGKICVVTGSNTGIGFETAKSLALHGCHVVLACRSSTAAQEAVNKIKHEKPDAHAEYMHLSLDKLQSVKDFADEFNEKFEKLDILILNAGVFGVYYSQTVDGYETLFQVNHLSQAYLTLLLEDKLTRAAHSRVVFVSSESHRFSNLTVATMTEETLSPKSASGYWGMMSYNNSKLLNVIFADIMAEKWAKKGIVVFSVHPGNLVYSDITRYWWPYKLLFALVRPFTKSLQQAASTTVYCATAPELDSISGLYFNNCCRTEKGKSAQDPNLSCKVWSITREMILKAGFHVDP